MHRVAGFELKGIEISPEAIRVAGELGRRVHQDDGAALIIDYGQDGPYAESLVAIRGHRRVPLLEQPGMADLSAHVDFDALRCAPLAPAALFPGVWDRQEEGVFAISSG
jgi:NADH dehydrogenase [ubiquinone] 1 alpha subcomplex assembly factor 7